MLFSEEEVRRAAAIKVANVHDTFYGADWMRTSVEGGVLWSDRDALVYVPNNDGTEAHTWLVLTAAHTFAVARELDVDTALYGFEQDSDY